MKRVGIKCVNFSAKDSRQEEFIKAVFIFVDISLKQFPISLKHVSSRAENGSADLCSALCSRVGRVG